MRNGWVATSVNFTCSHQQIGLDTLSLCKTWETFKRFVHLVMLSPLSNCWRTGPAGQTWAGALL